MKQKSIFGALISTSLAVILFTSCFGFGDDDMNDSSVLPQNSPSQSMTDNSTKPQEDTSDDILSDSTMTNSDTSDSMMDESTSDSENHVIIDDDSSLSLDEPGTNSQSITSDDNSISSSKPVNNIIEEEWNMKLVNAQNPLMEGFVVELRSIKGYDERLFDIRAADELEALLDAAKTDGLELFLVSAYRTPQRQATLFENKVQSFLNEGFMRSEAEKQAVMWVARAYTSEHNLGLAADLVSKDWYKANDDLTQEFENTPHFKWLVQNCAEYGFILRYPKEKENITGVAYEPWHFRYVGQEAAKIIMQSGVTLEEYLKEV